MVERGVKSEHGGGGLFLPPGFRFHPTDEEVITSYLLQKLLNPSFDPQAIGEVDLNKCEPWDLPSKAKMGEKEWFFFSHKDMKYPTGMRTNRATEKGYWKATGKDREIFKSVAVDGGAGRELVGMKKTLVFYMGRAPRGSKTNWVMHEFRLEGKSRHNNAKLRFNPKDEWVVCKVHHKNGEAKKPAEEYSAGTPNISSVISDDAGEADDFLDSMINPMFFNSDSNLPSMTMGTTSSFVDLPSYGFNDTAASINNSSWNMLQADHNNQAMERSYNLHHQAMVAKAALGGNHFSSGGLPGSSVTAGILQQNTNSVGMPQQNLLGNYGGSYAIHLPKY